MKSASESVQGGAARAAGTGTAGEVHEIVSLIETTVVGALDRAGCAEQMGRLKRLRAWLDASELQVMRRQQELAAEGSAEPADLAAARNTGRSSKSSREVRDRVDTCAALPGLEDALAAGSTTSEYVDVLSSVVRGLDDETRRAFLARRDELLGHATTDSVDTFRRRCRQVVKQLLARRANDAVDELTVQRQASRVRRWVDKVTGMHHTHLEVDPVRDAAIWGAIDAQLRRVRSHDQQGAKRTSFRQLQVDAVVAAVSAGEAGSRVPEIGVLVDWQTLADEADRAGVCRHVRPACAVSDVAPAAADAARSDAGFGSRRPERAVCETVDGVPLSPATVRRLACDANILPIVLGGDGVPLDLGRASRSATPGQRRALAALHATCGHPDCCVGFSATRAHHVRHWTRDRGPTDVSNLLPLCEEHHHLVHEGGWSLTMTADRVATWRLPDGSVYHEGSTIDRVEPVLND